ncbi:SacI-like domain-containing protein [Xylariomycetidae sp. FL2044]|nr:SacI-like domain-containing protein [Xylariomycetidae sp. FL2044]
MAESIEPNVAKTSNGQPPPGATAQPPPNGDVDPSAQESPLSDDESTEPAFPLLQNNASSETLLQNVPAQKRGRGGGGAGGAGGSTQDDIDEEPAVARPFVRTSSPNSSPREATPPGEEDDDGRSPTRLAFKMHKFTLYETASRYYIVGGDVTEKRYRILKIDRNTHDSDLSITDDKMIYSQKEMNALLDTIDDGNKGTGGIKQRCTTWGLLGFIRFTGPYYMLLITKKSTVAMVGGHYVYQIDDTELIPLTPPKYRTDARNAEESRFLGILKNLDLKTSFYYSYSYDITRTLQHNVTRERIALMNGSPRATYDDFNSMFIWNSYLLQPATEGLHDPYDWCRPIIHGYIDQAAIDVYGKTAHITIIARRSRYFAGARFLKRGANDLGYVANDVETEQIVSESLTTSFHSPGPKLYASPQYTSYVQHRGSIPLYWTQDNIGVAPKPPIELNLVDPFYTAAALHFDNLFERYGSPIYVLNLVKARERAPRESKLLQEYSNAIEYLNQFLPDEHRIIHKAWDMSRAAKSRDQDVIGTLEGIAESVVTTTGFFQNGDGVISPIQVQNGVARTNCIDCLDRTNAAQFVIGKRALGHQLHALGILSDTSIEYDTDAVNLFTHMYHDHGDTIAVQYGGSQLVNTMETYRKINQWTSHSRDMIESFKRYYNNSFLDSQRQEAYNLFLGNYIFAQGGPMLWDLSTDYYLHHADPRTWSEQARHDYIRWFTPRHLQKRQLPVYVPLKGDLAAKPVSAFDDYWLEYYRPSTLSSFLKMFPYKMNSTIKYIPFKSTQEGRYDLSPFRVRTEGDQEVHERKRPAASSSVTTKKEVIFADPHDALKSPETDADAASVSTEKRGISLQRWLQPTQSDKTPTVPHSIMKESLGTRIDGSKTKQTPQEKSKAAQWTFTKVVHESLNPSVSAQEADDYARYVSHPQTLPLVVSNEAPSDVDSSEYQEYLHGSWQIDGLLAALPSSNGNNHNNHNHHNTNNNNNGGSRGTNGGGHITTEDDLAAYRELLRIGENPLTVTEEDLPKKRYKAYQKWLTGGKSFFKQQPVD